MTRMWFVVVCCGLLSATSMFAQTGGAAADPLSGAWTGELVIEKASRRIPITLELKFDGKSAVSGTVSGLPNPAVVRVGTFDPKTGALKLQLGKKDDSAILLTLEGTVTKGTASGRVIGDGTGEFKIAKRVETVAN